MVSDLTAKDTFICEDRQKTALYVMRSTCGPMFLLGLLMTGRKRVGSAERPGVADKPLLADLCQSVQQIVSATELQHIF